MISLRNIAPSYCPNPTTHLKIHTYVWTHRHKQKHDNILCAHAQWQYLLTVSLGDFRTDDWKLNIQKVISSSAITVSNKEKEEIVGVCERDRDRMRMKVNWKGEEQSEKGQCELLHLSMWVRAVLRMPDSCQLRSPFASPANALITTLHSLHYTQYTRPSCMAIST